MKKSKEVLRPVALGFLSAGVALGVAGCGSHTSIEDGTHANMVEYGNKFKGLSPAQKFAAAYTTHIALRVVKDDVPTEPGTYWETRIGNACLDGTAYDIDGGTFEVKFRTFGLLSGSRTEIKAKIPTALATPLWDPNNPDIIRIKAGKEASPDLVFKGLSVDDDDLSNSSLVEFGTYLEPADEFTDSTLQTWGCKNGFVETVAVDLYGNELK